MAGLADTARFRTDDPEELVAASLVCPVCLGSDDVEWELEPYGYDPSARCECRHCERSWRVYLTPHQALRLSLMTPAHTV
jgi:hypothetical protein